MKNLRNFGYVVLITLVTVAFAQARDLPHFKKNEGYTSIRAKMLKAGWKRFHSEDADTCMDGDLRCQGRP